MSDDTVNIEVNGVPLKARKGQMIMQVTDPADIYIPRFCYHDKLSVAANCRMCLVEVEKAPKPMPACATPVTEGMKVFTKSPKAVAAQRATMEFLLINHPLDCPICDQGGECELQDLALGYGRDISRFSERKRVVKDKNLGPLVSTDMTRCIHCTRCVRFGQEIQGYPQMGTTGRGEHMEVGTYIEHSVDHELSANIIDLCPVGALNNKPFRYHARAWEMTQQALVSPHDAFGTNLYAHVLRGKLMRMVPRENEEINETWIADRDRFGFEGMYSRGARHRSPCCASTATLQAVDWEVALTAAAEGLQKAAAAHGGGAAGIPGLAHGHRRGAVPAGANCARLGQRQYRSSPAPAGFSGPGERGRASRISGSRSPTSNASKACWSSVRICAMKCRCWRIACARRRSRAAQGRLPQSAPLRLSCFRSPPTCRRRDDLVAELAALVHAAAAAAQDKPVPAGVRAAHGQRTPTAAVVGALTHGSAPRRHSRHLGAAASGLRANSRRWPRRWRSCAAPASGCITEGANAAGAYLAGAVPHRAPGGAPARARRASRRVPCWSAPLKAYVLFGGIDPADDLRGGCRRARQPRIWWSRSPRICRRVFARRVHVVLPIGSFAETSGTFVNAEGRWQSWAGAAKLPGESRPGWKVLRVLGELAESSRHRLRQLRGNSRRAEGAVRQPHRAVAARCAAGDAAAVPPGSGRRRAPGWTFRRIKAMCWCAAPRRCRKPRTGA